MKRKNLRTHKRAAHGNQREFVCSVDGCGKAFNYKQVLERHVLSCHVRDEDDDVVRPVKRSKKEEVVRLHLVRRVREASIQVQHAPRLYWHHHNAPVMVAVSSGSDAPCLRVSYATLCHVYVADGPFVEAIRRLVPRFCVGCSFRGRRHCSDCLVEEGFQNELHPQTAIGTATLCVSS